MTYQDWLELQEVEEGVSSEYRLRYKPNGKQIGFITQDVDGYYYWWPPHLRGGSWQAVWLRQIADMLDDLNKDWDKEVTEHFEAERQKDAEQGHDGTPTIQRMG